jgi:hypothetical protein
MPSMKWIEEVESIPSLVGPDQWAEIAELEREKHIENLRRDQQEKLRKR